MTTTETKREEAVPEAETFTAHDVSMANAGSEGSGKGRSAGIAAQGRRAAESAVKVKTLAVGVIMVALVASVGVLGWQLHAKSGDISAMRGAEADRAHAERIALDYAVAAAQMDFKDLPGWQARLTKGTTPELTNKLKQAANSMDQIISPLQWTSTSTPIVAKVRSESDGKFAVDCFVSVMTKNTQAPQGIQSTATYRLTLDKNQNWVISDVGGIDSALAAK
ncbi:hypothetical protein B7C42_03109 [Nocardia cerradoensis]|uniref:Mce-associated membrane protein n=1 Tax=Nocardia cerradoensis TaxID=85688 RepID=A0A231H8N6_9NOCA|nr:hypothetical protein [Nocardia cerradoensis]OXR45152.1 hypothetical protein B7C42_03109 [Nocardia cerradoensis]